MYFVKLLPTMLTRVNYSIYKMMLVATLIIAGGTLLSSCSDSPTAATQPSVQIIAPQGYSLSGHASVVPFVINNSGDSSISNISYTLQLSDSESRDSFVIESASAAKCATIDAHQFCQLNVKVAANAHVGDLALEAHIGTRGNDASFSHKLYTKVNNLLDEEEVADSVTSPAVSLTPNTLHYSSGLMVGATSGADSLTIAYPSVVQKTGSNNYAIITATVTTTPSGFNTIGLVDDNGNPLTYTLLSGNSGQGMTDLSAGSVVNLLVTIPNGNTSIQFKMETMEYASNGTISNQSISSTLHTINVVTGGYASASVSPSAISLTDTNGSQYITIANIGAYQIKSLTFATTDQAKNIVLSLPSTGECGGTLAPNASCNMLVSFSPQAVNGGSATIVVTYKDLVNNQYTQTIPISYTSATMFGGLSISSVSNPNFDFNNFTSSSATSSVITLTNNGTANIESITSSGLPSQFTMTPTGSQPCTSVLNIGASCTMLLTYNNSSLLALTHTSVNFAYSYIGDHGGVFSASSNMMLNYQTQQSSAILSANVTSNFASISNNGADVQTGYVNITNTGNDAASGISLSVSGDVNHVFSVVAGGDCGTTLSAGSSCTQAIQYGPTTSSSIGTQTGILNISYLANSAAKVNSTSSIALSAQLLTPISANLNASLNTISSSIVAGAGSSLSPYLVQQNSGVATVTYTLTNSGPGAASNVKLNYTATKILPWTVTQDGCSNTPLAINDSCQIVLSLTPTSIGSNNLGLSNLSVTWVDQDDPSGTSQLLSNGMTDAQLHVNVFAPASISTTISNSANPLVFFSGNSFVVTNTLVGGYNVSQDISANITNDTKNYVSLNNSSCSLSSAQPSCNITATINGVTTAETGVNLNLSASGSPITPSSYTFNIAVFYAYATSYKISGNNILIYSLNPTTGHLTQLSSLPNAPKANKIIVDASGQRVYVANSASPVSSIAMYAINPLTGLLNPLSTPSVTAGNNLFDIAISPSNKFVYGANLNSSTVSMYGLDSLSGILNPLAPASIATGVSPINIQFTPDGLFAYVVNNNMDTISMYSVATSGQLSPIVPNTVATGSDPVAIRATANGKYAYVANSQDNTISVYSINNGVLANIGSATTGVSPNDIAITADSKYVYAVNALSDTLSMYSIASNGLLTSLGTIATGAYPRSITVDPTGQYVYVSNYKSGTISVYGIGSNGVLSSITTISTGGANSFPVNLAITPAIY